MLFLREFVVRKHERGLLFKNGDFERFLAPSTYRFFDPLKRIEVESYDLSQPAFEHRLLDFLIRWYPEEIESLFVRVETGPGQVAVVYENCRATAVVGPNRRALFWKGVVHVKAETIDIATELAVAPRLKKAVVADFGAHRSSAFEHAVLVREVPDGHAGLLYVDGQIVGELGPGVHAFWRFNRSVAVELIDLRVKTLEIAGQEVLTKDRVGLHVDLSAHYRFADARRAVTAVEDPVGFLYKEAQLGLRAAAGARTLDALLGDQGAVGRAVLEHVRDRFAAIGIEVGDVRVDNVRLEANPTALRLKELETLEKISDRVGSISALGGLEDALHSLVRTRL